MNTTLTVTDTREETGDFHSIGILTCYISEYNIHWWSYA